MRYGDTVILRNINWTVRAGESWALLGPNGSGKTTLLSLILGDNPQVYTNDIVVFGRPRGSGESVWEIKQHIGWVSPELHLHFNDSATCFEVVASGFHDTVGLFQPPSARQRTAARRCLARFQLLDSRIAPSSPSRRASSGWFCWPARWSNAPACSSSTSLARALIPPTATPSSGPWTPSSAPAP